MDSLPQFKSRLKIFESVCLITSKEALSVFVNEQDYIKTTQSIPMKFEGKNPFNCGAETGSGG